MKDKEELPTKILGSKFMFEDLDPGHLLLFFCRFLVNYGYMETMSMSSYTGPPNKPTMMGALCAGPSFFLINFVQNNTLVL